MAFFVELSESDRLNSNSQQMNQVDIEMLALAKRTGLSFAEMNELRVKDLFAYTRAYTATRQDGTRMATQEDIDRLLA